MLNKKDKILVENSLEILADAVIDTIAKQMPLINIPYNLSKALYGAGMKLRQQRVLEWVEMIRDNPHYFVETVLADEMFQDGFVVAMEKYLTERNLDKRIIFRNIFLGFTQIENKESFPLEKLVHTLSQLNEIDIATLSDVDIERADDQNYQIFGNNVSPRQAAGYYC